MRASNGLWLSISPAFLGCVLSSSYVVVNSLVTESCCSALLEQVPSRYLVVGNDFPLWPVVRSPRKTKVLIIFLWQSPRDHTITTMEWRLRIRGSILFVRIKDLFKYVKFLRIYTLRVRGLHFSSLHVIPMYVVHLRIRKIWFYFREFNFSCV